MRWKVVLLLCLVAVLTSCCAAWADAASDDDVAKQPFEGKYLLVGDPARLLEPGPIQVLMFFNPTCPNCHLFHKYSRGVLDRFGDRVKVERIPYMHKNEGEEAIRLILAAERHGKADQALDALFRAKFESLVDIDDPEVVAFVAQGLGLGDVYKAERDAQYVEERLAKSRELAERIGVERTPFLLVQQVLQINSGTCKCQGDELPSVLAQTLDSLIEYRKAKGIQP